MFYSLSDSTPLCASLQIVHINYIFFTDLFADAMQPTMTSWLLLLFWVSSIAVAYEDDNPLAIGKCQRITVPLCSNVPYNFTRLPNMLGHRDQEKVTFAIFIYFLYS